MRKLITFLRRTSILRRLLYLSLIQVLIIALLCASTVRSTMRELHDSLRLSAAQTFSTVSGQLAQAYNEIDMLTKFPVMQAAYGRTSIFDYLSEDSESYVQLIDYYRNIQADLQNILVLYSDVATLGISNMKGTVVYCSKEATAYSVSQIAIQSTLVQHAFEQRGRLITVANNKCSTLLPELNIDEDNWLGIRALMKLNHLEPVGVAICTVDLSHIRQTFDLSRIYEEQELCILDADGEILIGQPLPNTLLSAAKTTATTDIQFITVKDNRDTSIWQSFTDANGFNIQIRTPQRCLHSTVWERLTGLLIALAVLVIGALLITVMLILSIRDPIAKLVNVCERIQAGDYSPIPDDNARDEMHTLVTSINLMAGHIEQLITEVYTKSLLQAQTEMRLLRSQINPHFVYNTLETIRASALQHGNEELAEMASLLGRTLRYGVSEQSDPVPVAREIMHLEDYLHLMQIHLNGKLQYTITLEPGISHCLMIKLVLQPLVENAINHGFTFSEGQEQLSIMGYFLDNDLCFVVSDNGVGIKAEDLEVLTAYIEGRNDVYQSIGLRNTHRRIQLFYGEQYGLSIRSLAGRGTSIEVRLPRIEEKEVSE